LDQFSSPEHRLPFNGTSTHFDDSSITKGFMGAMPKGARFASQQMRYVA